MTLLGADEWQALALSVRVGLISVLVSLPFALGWAWLLSRSRLPGRTLLEALMMLPLALPPVVSGYALLVLFGRNGWIGSALAELGIVFAFRWTGAVLAACVMGFPLLVLSIRVAFDQVDRNLERAAETLGAGAWRRFITIVLPLSMRGIIAGCVLAFARAFGEFGATITFVSSIPGETRTLSIAIYEFMNLPDGEAGVQRLTVVALVVALGATLSATMLNRTLWGRPRD